MIPQNKQFNIEERLNRIERPILSAAEKENLWKGIVGLHQERKEIASPYFIFSFVSGYRSVFAGILVLVFLGLGVGTAAASNASVPGDILYFVDRAVEDVRIALADKPVKDNLRIAFAKERVSEVQTIIAQETAASKKLAVTILQQDTTMLKKTDEPAIIFEDIGDQGSTSSSGIPETLIQVEVDGKTRGLATTTRERKNIIEEIVDALGGEEPIVEQTLTNEPAQDLKEQDDIPVRFREDTVDLNVPRVKEGLTAAIEFLTSVSQEFDRDGNEAAQKAFEEVINTLNLEISQVPSEVIVEAVEPVHDNKKMATSSVEKEYSEQESTTDIRIQIKEGKVELYRPLIESQIIPEQNNAPVSLDTDVPQIVAAEKEELPEKIRVEIEDDRAKVSFEMNDTKHKAFFPYTNTEALIAGIAAAYDLSEEVIKAVIDIQ